MDGKRFKIVTAGALTAAALIVATNQGTPLKASEQDLPFVEETSDPRIGLADLGRSTAAPFNIGPFHDAWDRPLNEDDVRAVQNVPEVSPFVRSAAGRRENRFQGVEAELFGERLIDEANGGRTTVAGDVAQPEVRPVSARVTINSLGPKPKVVTASATQAPFGSAIEPASEELPEESTGAARVETAWSCAGALETGMKRTLSLVVENTGKGLAADVQVEVVLPESFRVLTATPEPERSPRQSAHPLAGGEWSWNLGDLSAGEREEITFEVEATEGGDVQPRAIVRHATVEVGTFAVLNPLLDVSLQGPDSVVLGETFMQDIIVSNAGNGVLRSVVLEASLPEGLRHDAGCKLRTEIGDVAAGQMRSIQLKLTAAKGGPQPVHVRALCEGGRDGQVECDVAVRTANVTATVSGPAEHLVGRERDYTVTAVNGGGAAREEVSMTYRVPAGYEVVSIADGGRFDATRRHVRWPVGLLEEWAEVSRTVTLRATGAGTKQHLARVSGNGMTPADASFSTVVEGFSALSISVAEAEDPVEVSGTARYEVTVRNDGTAAAHNVAVECELPDGTELLSAEMKGGAVRREDNRVTFRPVETLPAGEELRCEVHVRGLTAGMKRFRTVIRTDETDSLISEEVTRFYGE